ncbi:MAG: FG-GAP repeat domain-containing protein [Flammeovirgaceae bacterium]
MRLGAFFASLLFLMACQPPEPSGEKLFTRLSYNHSNIHFQNFIQEDERINILTYEYTYNGGGVAAADFNNDGLCDLYFVGNAVDNKLWASLKTLRILPICSQFSVAFGLLIHDFNQDGWQDLLVGGNFQDYKTNYGPSDASKGTVLFNDQKGGFLAQGKLNCGKMLSSEIRNFEKL